MRGFKINISISVFLLAGVITAAFAGGSEYWNIVVVAWLIVTWYDIHNLQRRLEWYQSRRMRYIRVMERIRTSSLFQYSPGIYEFGVRVAFELRDLLDEQCHIINMSTPRRVVYWATGGRV